MTDDTLRGLWADPEPKDYSTPVEPPPVVVNVVNEGATGSHLASFAKAMAATQQIGRAFGGIGVNLAVFDELDDILDSMAALSKSSVTTQAWGLSSKADKASRDEHLKNSRHKNQKGPVKRGYK